MSNGVDANGQQQPGFFGRVGQLFVSQFATWIVGLGITVATIFSTPVTEKIKLEVNRADLRFASFEALSKDLRAFVFASELLLEVIDKNLTTEKPLAAAIADYNGALVKIKVSEYYWQAILQKYWESKHQSALIDIFKKVDLLDKVMHEMNADVDKILSSGNKPAAEPAARFPADAAARYARNIKPKVEELQGLSRDFVLSLM